MKNIKLLSRENLLHNLGCFKSKKICAMVKSNAYGHGLREIVKLIENDVDYFGVAHIEEGVEVRKISDKPILVCSKISDFKKCKKHNLEVMVEDEVDIQNCLNYGLKDAMHLKINCGMNRFGVGNVLYMGILNDLLEEKQINLRSIYTHFHCLEDKKQTLRDYKKFQMLRAEILQNTTICFGGSGIVNYPFEFDMVRLGIGLYGYGQKKLKPVMQISSYVSKIFYAKSGEYIGYGKKCKVRNGGYFAIVPVGYGDGLRRNLSGDFKVLINEKSYKSVANICMDAFFVKVDENVRVGDKVVCMFDADYIAKKIDTIPYEILTGFSSFRGDTLIL